MWAETRLKEFGFKVSKISIHSTRVGGDLCWVDGDRFYYISIHSTRVGGDGSGHSKASFCFISIHSTRVGGDVDKMPT